jgi:periplasmic protein TonB
MHASIREPLVFGVIVVLHAAALWGLAHLQRHDEAVPVAATMSVRLISPPAEQERSEPKPFKVAAITPRVALDPPPVPVLDIDVMDEAPNAITIPVHAAPPRSTNEGPPSPKVISSVEYVREPAPRYPPVSRRLGEQGLVMLKVLIDERGVACSIEIQSSSGYARLDHAAREAVARAEFRPYVEDGQPRRALVLIPIEFYLNRTSA